MEEIGGIIKDFLLLCLWAAFGLAVGASLLFAFVKIAS